MKQIIFFLLLSFTPVLLSAQLQENFQDGDFNNNPTWSGDNALFVVDNEILALNASVAGTAFLSTPVNIADSTSWDFWIRLDLNPSASGNFPKIYLSSDNSDLSGPLNGYFLRIGESNANDAFELYRQDGTDETFLLRFNTEGEMGASSNNTARIQVTRNDSGLWRCGADYTGGNCFLDEGNVTDNTFTTGTHFGFFCKYTITNIDNFSFDDVYIDAIVPGSNDPLNLENLSPISVNDLQLFFSKIVDQASAEMVTNYSIENAGGGFIGNPISATLDGSDPTLVHLDISNLAINSGDSYNLIVNNVLDCSGNNISTNNSLPFQIFITELADPFDILINEIFADPDMNISSLPNEEFIELYNRSNKNINLQDFIFSDASSETTLPAYVLEANSYVIICATDNEPLYSPFGATLGINGFPSLNNASDDLTLKDQFGNNIHQAFYTTAWYQDPDKANGGWTLELGNPELYCQGASNWSASNNAIGGTPGTQNSTFNNAPDTESPKLLNAIPLSDNQVRLIFDEVMTDVLSTNLFQLSGATGGVQNVLLEQPDQNSILLSINAPFLQDQITYTVSLQAGLTDCSGNSISTDFNSADFTYYVPEDAEAFDILINEIFAAPDMDINSLPNEEFIELYNRSNKNINLQGFLFSDASSETTLSSYFLTANSYVIICATENESLFSPFGPTLEIDGFPALNNAGDDLTLKDPLGNIIHQAFYTTAWYQDTEKDNGGWTLELGNPELYCQGASNWSASNNSIGGTPGTQNSTFNDVPDTEGPRLLGVIPFSENQIRLVFNEVITETLNPDLFQLSGATGGIQNALLEQPAQTSVLLSINAPFLQDQTSYTISLQAGLTDCSGNPISTNFNSTDFTYYIPEAAEAYDILINEIFADPTPVIGLPDAEYIELFNRSDKNISLENFILADRDDEIVLPYHLLQAGAHVIIYEDGSGSFGIYGDTLAVDFLFGLGNTVDDLELLNSDGDIIHAVNYNIGWYQDSGKSDGGWSLEMINPNNYCNVDNNWRASVNPTGGTPGIVNSVIENTPDESTLDLICAYPNSSNEISLFFNKATNADLLLGNFNIDGFTINSIEAVPPLFNTALLNIEPAMQAGETYTIFVKTEQEDCRGNNIGVFNEVRIALPDFLAKDDVVINEVLFNPETGGTDFVELFNRSNKVIDLSSLFIATRDDRDSIDSPEAVQSNCLLFPSDFIVLTENPLDIQNRYQNTSFYDMTETGLPTYEDKEGTVVLYVPVLATASIIDEFSYMESMHYPLLSDKNGVSLERINPSSPTQSDDNWHSAAEAVGFATPTYQNSQFISNNNTIDDELLWLENDRLSPDNDGFEDFLQIQYALDQSGFTANINIYDAKGRLIKRLVENELLLIEGNIKWDGVNDDGNRARTGVHVLEAKLLNTDGTVKQYRLPFVVASQL